MLILIGRGSHWKKRGGGIGKRGEEVIGRRGGEVIGRRGRRLFEIEGMVWDQWRRPWWKKAKILTRWFLLIERLTQCQEELSRKWILK